MIAEDFQNSWLLANQRIRDMNYSSQLQKQDRSLKNYEKYKKLWQNYENQVESHFEVKELQKLGTKAAIL